MKKIKSVSCKVPVRFSPRLPGAPFHLDVLLDGVGGTRCGSWDPCSGAESPGCQGERHVIIPLPVDGSRELLQC